MKKEFVPYQLALELKQLGFNEPCLASYYHAGKKLDIAEYVRHGEYTVLAPLYQQAFEWFRFKGLEIKVEKESEGLYFGFYFTGVAWMLINEGTYQDVELSCLKKLIEIANEQQ
jgi:hypothetical protein